VDPNFTPHDAIERRKPPKRLVYYQDSPIRKDWDHPSPDEVAESLNHAHWVNRRLVKTVNELYDTDDQRVNAMEELRQELKTSKLKNTVLTSIFSSAVTAAILSAMLAILKALGH
jgi:hypothetical protein